MPMTHMPPNQLLWPPSVHPLGEQEERFNNTWLDQNRASQQEVEVQNAVVLHAYEHNMRQQLGGVSKI